jgi:acetyltransferase-like isoleucine patch superfamily enzyme
MKFNNSVQISKNAKIGFNVKIGNGVIIYDNVEIGNNSFIGPFCKIGEPTISYYKNPDNHSFKRTGIGRNSILRSNSIIYEGVTVGDFFQTGHNCIIREDSIIGHHTSFGNFSELPGQSQLGNYVRIHSKVMLSEQNIIEDYVWIFPSVVITNTKYPPVSEILVTHIKEYALIFASAIILPGITIGENAIIGAGALVTKNVPKERLIIGNPGRDIKSVREIKDENGNSVYPWKDYLTTDRGYPWQNYNFIGTSDGVSSEIAFYSQQVTEN